jgi:hypothetical protein
MVFSLVILALPVGVIGGNFSAAWSLYESQKNEAMADQERDRNYITAAIERIDPREMSKLMLIEIWNERCPVERTDLSGKTVLGPPREICTRPDQGEFMGMATVKLEQPPDSQSVQTHTLKLRPSGEDGQYMNVTGTITLKYEWTPMHMAPTVDEPPSVDGSLSIQPPALGDGTKPGPAPVVKSLRGKLKVTIIGADNLTNLTYVRHPNTVSNPYAMVFLYPNSSPHGEPLVPIAWRSPSVVSTQSPRWGYSNTWDYLWLAPPGCHEPPRTMSKDSSLHDSPRTISQSASIHPEPPAVDSEGKVTTMGSKQGCDFRDGEILQALQHFGRDISALREEVRSVGGRIFQEIDGLPKSRMETFAPPSTVAE